MSVLGQDTVNFLALVRDIDRTVAAPTIAAHFASKFGARHWRGCGSQANRSSFSRTLMSLGSISSACEVLNGSVAWPDVTSVD